MTATSYNLSELFESVVDAVPADRLAVVCGDRRLTYRELEERANRLAHWLAAHGIGRGDHVGCYMHNGTEYLETMLALFKIRAVPINVNFRYVHEELRYLYEDADLVGVVFDAEFADRVAAVLPQTPKVEHLVAVGPYDGFDLPQGTTPDDVDLVVTRLRALVER